MSINTREKYWVSPAPPLVRDELAHIGAGLRFAQGPTDYLKALRGEYGDTFLVDVFGYKLFCVFSPTALQSLYAVAEDDASFGMATFDMLGFKTPLEVFLDADIDLFYELLQPDRLERYISDFDTGISQVLAEWGEAGDLNVFDTIRTLQQRVGFRLWIGEEATEQGTWQQFKAAFDVLSQENAFVSPQLTLETLTSDKAKERAAIKTITELIAAIVEQRQRSDRWPDDTLSFLYHRFHDDDPQVTLRKVVHNTINANQGFLSNLYAALSWTLINLLRYPDVYQRMRVELAETIERYGPDFLSQSAAMTSLRFCEQLLMESIRFAQRSITLRKVMQEIEFDCGDTQYTLQPGVYVTTMLSVINTQTEELARFDPDHYEGRRIRQDLIAAGKETVSTFGHGSHACPAQKFSHSMSKVLLARILEQFDLSALAGDTRESIAQMGGVARAQGEVTIHYARKEPPG